MDLLDGTSEDIYPIFKVIAPSEYVEVAQKAGAFQFCAPNSSQVSGHNTQSRVFSLQVRKNFARAR
jgi:hypothetical protein